MALDIYAGPLCRYHAGMWESVAQRAAREEGLDYQVIRAEDEDQEVLTLAEVRTAVVAWRDHISTFFADTENLQFTWEEDEEADYFTDRLGWGGYFALLLTAARPEGEPLPPNMLEDPREDPFFQAAADAWEQSPFAHLIRPEIWLPIPESLIFEAKYLTRDSINIGTIQGLLFQLRGLNDSRFNMDARDLEAASFAEPDYEDSVEAQARYGLAVMMRAAEWAIENRLPIILDY